MDRKSWPRGELHSLQGHSTPADPPDLLFDGTVRRALASIRDRRLHRLQRHHVHLSLDGPAARAVGSCRDQPVVSRIDARALRQAGHLFRTPNGVWLTDAVPASFICGFDDE